MRREFILPDLGEGLHEATLVAWKIREGDFVRADQPLAEVETDKATAELPSPFTGRIVKLHFQPGDRVPVGSVLVTFEVQETAEAAPTVAATPVPSAVAPGSESTPPPAPKTIATTAPSTPSVSRADSHRAAPAGRPILAAPITRKIAREHGVNLADVPGTGPGGRITTEDVLAYVAARQGGRRPEAPAAAGVAPEVLRPVAAPPAAPPGEPSVFSLTRPPLPDFAHWGPVERQPATAIRRRIAERMTLAHLLPATVTHADEADITELEQARAQAKALAEAQGVRLTLLPYVIKAVVAALKRWPLFNASFDEQRNEIVIKKYYHIGVAVDTPQGLLVPVVRDADRKSVLQLAQELAQLAERARQGKLSADEMRGGSFTITNIGSIGGTFFTPIINWPEVAILGLGRIQERLVLVHDKPTARKILPLCLSFDHRLLDGADAARFVNELSQFLENPAKLLLFC
ncbi:MAG: dihydrolipoamide acetyltransferase family protein [Gemmatales bacterium]|nr:2-oxo acid dehydrogenase subunit E2 [Gemmatales bacterium]MDW7994953.1 dihydrolipoamide acetyltransferase family protein [Gemmatales bacterium]